MRTKKQKCIQQLEPNTLNPTRFFPSTDKQTRDESTLRLTRALTNAECATVLHGLRTIQADGRIEGCAAGMCDHFEDVEPLTNDQIDELCEAINLQPSAVPVAVSESNTWTPSTEYNGRGIMQGESLIAIATDSANRRKIIAIHAAALDVIKAHHARDEDEGTDDQLYDALASLEYAMEYGEAVSRG